MYLWNNIRSHQNTTPTGVLGKDVNPFLSQRDFRGLLYLSLPQTPASVLSFHKERTCGPGRFRLLYQSLCFPSTLDRDTRGPFQDYFSQGDNLLLALCMSAELLNFEDSWVKLDVANLHLQIDFVHMGVCTHISRDKVGNEV